MNIILRDIKDAGYPFFEADTYRVPQMFYRLVFNYLETLRNEGCLNSTL